MTILCVDNTPIMLQSLAENAEKAYPHADVITLTGHSLSHLPQLVQSSASIWARLFSSFIAPASQALAHLPQPIHPAEHTLRVTAPLSVDEHLTALESALTMSIIPRGQTAAHFLHAMQFKGLTFAMPFTMLRASFSHTSTQSPSPKQE